MAEDKKTVVSVPIDRKFPATCVAVMVFILLLAVFCGGAYGVVTYVNAKYAPIEIKGKGKSLMADYPTLKALPTGVAAQVKGVNIPESKITDYIMQLRERNRITTEDEWDIWLINNEFSSKTIRERLILYFVNQEIIKQAAEELGVTVSEEEIAQRRREIFSDSERIKSAIDLMSSEGLSFADYGDYLRVELLKEKSGIAANTEDPNSEKTKAYILRTIKAENEQYKDATSLDEVDPDIVQEVTERVIDANNTQAYVYFIKDFVKDGVYYSEMPEGLPYKSDLDMYYSLVDTREQLKKSKIEIPDDLFYKIVAFALKVDLPAEESAQ